MAKNTNKRKQLELDCIKKFFYEMLPNLQKISENKVFRKIIGGDVNSLGVEGALEACIGLFEDGRLQLKARSIDNFIVFTIFDDNLMVLYDTKEKT